MIPFAWLVLVGQEIGGGGRGWWQSRLDSRTTLWRSLIGPPRRLVRHGRGARLWRRGCVQQPVDKRVRGLGLDQLGEGGPSGLVSRDAVTEPVEIGLGLGRRGTRTGRYGEAAGSRQAGRAVVAAVISAARGVTGHRIGFGLLMPDTMRLQDAPGKCNPERPCELDN